MTGGSSSIGELPFAHHTFSEQEAGGPFELISSAAAEPVDPIPEEVSQIAARLRGGGVSEIILIHGTFVGNDIVGALRQMGRFSPGLARNLSEVGKRWIDEFVGEVGNYTPSFADCLRNLVNPAGESAITVTRLPWSGENHHLGRAAGVIELLRYLWARNWTPDQRVLVLAHSHGGNLVAMLSQIVTANKSLRESFFDIALPHCQSCGNPVGFPDWQEVRRRLLASRPLAIPAIDVATFGTPLRYRWNTSVCSRLVHIVQHHPQSASEPTRTSVPRTLVELLAATGGDYVQHLGVAGTDFSPSILSWRQWCAERQLQKMFEPNLRRRDLLRRVRLGRRVSLDGLTLLVDYPTDQESWNRKLLGHGIYTCRRWLPFHLDQISSRFY